MGSYGRWAARWRVPLHFLLAAVLLAFGQPTGKLLTLGAVLVANGLLVRGWAAGHLRREKPLVVSGPYVYVRHPLYLGSGLLFSGFAVTSGRAWIAALIALYFVSLFIPVMRREERERRQRAPDLFSNYAERVPAFLPHRGRYEGARSSAAGFDWEAFRANREWRAGTGCALLLLLLYAKMLWL